MHDPVYRQLFSFRRMVADLLHAVGDADWTKDVDFDVLEKLPAEHVGGRLQQRRGDAEQQRRDPVPVQRAHQPRERDVAAWRRASAAPSSCRLTRATFGDELYVRDSGLRRARRHRDWGRENRTDHVLAKPDRSICYRHAALREVDSVKPI